MIYPSTDERRARTSGVGDAEGVLGERVQDPTGIVEEFQGLVTGVGDGCGHLQVLQPEDIGAEGRGPDGQAGGGRDGDRRGDEGDEGRAKGRRKHYEGVRGVDYNETLELTEFGLNSLPASGVTGEQRLLDRNRGSAGVHEYMQEIVRGMEGLLGVVVLCITGHLRVTGPTHQECCWWGILRCLDGDCTGPGEAIAKGRGQHKHRATAAVGPSLMWLLAPF